MALINSVTINFAHSVLQYGKLNVLFAEKDYVTATVVAIAWFLAFYIIAFLFSLVYHVR